MALMRSGQKNLDEIQRVRAAIEGGNLVITGAQRELIEKHATLLGEDGKAIIQDIQEEAEKDGKLLVDVFRLIDSCLHDLGRRAAIQELSNDMLKEREPERLVQVEAIREHATRLIGAWASGDNAALTSVRQVLLGLVEKFMVDVNRDKEDGLDPDTARNMEGPGARDRKRGEALPGRLQWRWCGPAGARRTDGSQTSGLLGPPQASH